MSKSRTSPRKFSEKIALLNKKEAEATAEFEKIIKEVEETTRSPSPAFYRSRASSSSSSWVDDRSLENQNRNSTILKSGEYVRYDPTLHLSQQVQHQHSPEMYSSCIKASGIPNIKISSIEDESYLQQRQQGTNNHRNIFSINSIGAARSLPDIANLNVSSPPITLSSSLFNPLAQSSSDQRLTKYQNDCRSSFSNFVSPPNNYLNYDTNHHHHHQIDSTSLNINNHQLHQLPSNPQRFADYQQQQPNFYQQLSQHNQTESMTTIQRASSINNVFQSNCHNNNDSTLDPSGINNYISKSYDDSYGHFAINSSDHINPPSNNYCDNDVLSNEVVVEDNNGQWIDCRADMQHSSHCTTNMTSTFIGEEDDKFTL